MVEHSKPEPSQFDRASSSRAWQRMLSGRRLDLLNPSPLDIEIEDIAHGLACVARWNGQTLGNYPYSVAAHSLLVEKIIGLRIPNLASHWRLAALLHDGAEYVLGDIISPAKSALGHSFEDLETRIQAVIHQRFSLPALTPADIKKKIKAADLSSAYLEAKYLAGFTEAELKKYFKKPIEPRILELRPIPLTVSEAKTAFLKRFWELSG